MKILHIVPSFGFGGMEKVICSIINSTIDQYDHELLSMDNNRDAIKWTREKQVSLVNFYKPNTRYKFFKSLYRSINARSPHLLMTYNWGSTDAIWLGRLSGINKIIHSEHGFNIDEAVSLSWKRDLVRFLVYRMASTTVVVSHELANMMRQKFCLNDQKIAFIPNGINAAYYTQNLSERNRVRAVLDFKNTDFVVGFSGRLDPVKNFDLMIKIFASCVSHDANFKFLIIGDGPEKKRLATMCKDMNIQNQVLLVGQKDDVLPYLRSLDAFLLTSYREQMPMTILEAMSVGIPVIASKVGEIPHIIDDGTDGFLVSPEAAPETWSWILLSMKNSSAYQSMGILARKKILDKFQEETMVRSYKNTIENVLYG